MPRVSQSFGASWPLSSSAASAGDKVSELQDNLGSTAENVLDTLKDKFLEAVVGALGDSFEPLSAAFDLFNQLSDMCGGGLDGGMGGIMDKIESIMEIIETIKPIAEMIESMLG